MERFPFEIQAVPDHGGALPAEADVVVIGGGIAGVMTAWHLAEAGLRAVILEKGRVAAEQSSRNWGWIRKQGRDAAELPLMMAAERFWAEVAPTLDVDIGLRRSGVLYLAETDRDEAEHAAFLGLAHEHGLDTVLLDGAGVAGLMPGAARRWRGGMWTASDQRAEPWRAVPALARTAVRRGAVIVEQCAARALYREAGRVAGVVTERGLIRAPEVVVAGGAWSALFLRREGVVIPQLAVLATVAATEPLPDIFAGAAADSGLAWRRRADGGYTLAAGTGHGFWIGPDAFRHFRAFVPQLRGEWRTTRFLPAAPAGFPDAWGTPRRWSEDEVSPFERMRILDPAPEARLLRGMAPGLQARFPGLGPVRIARAWAGMIDTMPDVLPVIDRVADVPGLTVATGLSGHGFGIGPEIGRVTAALVAGRDPGQDLRPFRIARFSDRRAPRPHGRV